MTNEVEYNMLGAALALALCISLTVWAIDSAIKDILNTNTTNTIKIIKLHHQYARCKK